MSTPHVPKWTTFGADEAGGAACCCAAPGAAESALQANEQRLAQILEAVPLGILVSDNEGHIVFASP